MAMIGAMTITKGDRTVIATGDQGNDEISPTVQVVLAQNNGLERGAYYTITKGDNTGSQARCSRAWTARSPISTPPTRRYSAERIAADRGASTT
jgi:hypothetical protein